MLQSRRQRPTGPETSNRSISADKHGRGRANKNINEKNYSKLKTGDVLLRKNDSVLKSSDMKRVPVIQVNANKKKKMSKSENLGTSVSKVGRQLHNTPPVSVSKSDRSPSAMFRAPSVASDVGNKTQRLGSGVYQRSVMSSPLIKDQQTQRQSSAKSSASSGSARSTSASSRKTSASSTTSGGTTGRIFSSKLQIVIISNKLFGVDTSV